MKNKQFRLSGEGRIPGAEEGGCMKRKREVEIICSKLLEYGVCDAEQAKVAVSAGLKQIRQEKFAQRHRSVCKRKTED